MNSRWPAVIITSGKKPGQKSHFNLYFLAANSQAIKKNNVANVFQNWGDLFKIEFSIKVTKLPTTTWTNVFHFTAHGNDVTRYGDRIPALYINKGGFFHVCSAVSGNKNYCKNVNFVLGKEYQMTIQQLKVLGKFWYEIIMDSASILKIENSQAQRFSNVKMYTSDPWYPSFTSDLGSITNIRALHGEG